MASRHLFEGNARVIVMEAPMSTEHLPVQEFLGFLRRCAEEEQGLKGAAYGAGMGAAMSIAAIFSQQRKLDPKAILSSVMIGAAFGAADHRHLRP
jgi:hypothetical protein